jgi:PAT family beta-lactamase induction signal transducer AmpG
MGVTILGTIVSKSFTATQFALLVALVSVPPRIISGGSGIIVDNMGFHEFFIICALLGIPAIIFSIMVHKKRKELGFE